MLSACGFLLGALNMWAAAGICGVELAAGLWLASPVVEVVEAGSMPVEIVVTEVVVGGIGDGVLKPETKARIRCTL